MSGVEGSTSYPFRNPARKAEVPPAPRLVSAAHQLPPCAPSRFEKSSARRRGVQSTTPPAPHSCAMIFLCDLSRRAATSSPSPLLRRGAFSVSCRSARGILPSTAFKFLTGYCETTRERGGLRRRGGEVSGLSSPRLVYLFFAQYSVVLQGI